MQYLCGMTENAVVTLPVSRIIEGVFTVQSDQLACEEPLEIRLDFANPNGRQKKSISVTMRTPGNDAELATGFLYTEGILKSNQEIKICRSVSPNIIEVELDERVAPDLKKLERNFYTTSSCGVCGKTSIEAIRNISAHGIEKESFAVPAALIYSLPALLRKTQEVFEQTGGLHASALYDLSGKLVIIREDVGRHNALDKLIGYFLMNGELPLEKHLLLLSGRASFELIQKAVMAGIRLVAAVGAPSSLAVELAKEAGITLIGFLREERFNIYCGEKRIVGEGANF